MVIDTNSVTITCQIEQMIKMLDSAIADFNNGLYVRNLYKSRLCSGYIAGLLQALVIFGYTYNYREVDRNPKTAFYPNNDVILIRFRLFDPEGKQIYFYELKKREPEMYDEMSEIEVIRWE